MEVLGLSEDSVMETVIRLRARAFRAEVVARHQRGSERLVSTVSIASGHFQTWSAEKVCFDNRVARHKIRSTLPRIFQGGA
jgi:hypothetical protein